MSPNRREWLAGMLGLGLASCRPDAPVPSAEPTVVPSEGIGRGIRHLARSDIGGRPDSVQVMFNRDHLYVGHMFSGGVSIVDVHDPSRPMPVGFWSAGGQTRTHHLQAAEDLLLVANGANIVAMQSYDDLRGYFENTLADSVTGEGQFRSGLSIHDISQPDDMREIAFLEMPGLGINRLWWAGGRYAYVSAHFDGFTDNVLAIVDLDDITRPEIVSRWWLPGMNRAGGEESTAEPGRRVALHHMITAGDLGYSAWRDGGVTIHDIGDRRNPVLLAHMNWSPPFPGGTHTALPLPGRDLVVVADEANAERCEKGLFHTFVVDVRVPENPVPIATLPTPDDIIAVSERSGLTTSTRTGPAVTSARTSFSRRTTTPGSGCSTLRTRFRPGNWPSGCRLCPNAWSIRGPTSRTPRSPATSTFVRTASCTSPTGTGASTSWNIPGDRPSIMSLAWIAIAALVIAVALSFTTAINVGIVAIALAWIIGVYLGGMSVGEVIDGFPTTLLVTLIGVTLLFSIAQSNGTLARVTGRAVGLCRGKVGLLPFMFFGLGLLIATIGPGGTPASALLAPPAMAVAGRAGISPFLMAIMVGNGTLGGTLSPFAPTGIVANGVMDGIGLGGVEWQTYAYNAVAHAVVAFGGFALFGGLRLFGRKTHAEAVTSDAGPMERRHWMTVAGIALFIVGVAGLDMHVGMTGFLISAILILLGTVDQREAIQKIPWGVILMVTGVSVLVSILEATQGMELFTSGMARVASPNTLAPIVAFGAGVISVYSSTSGVVLPAFLPMVPGLSTSVGVLDPLPVAWSMNVGASLVDLSSLSTVGALFLAAAPEGTDTRSLFNKLLAWGLAMSVVAAIMCGLWF